MHTLGAQALAVLNSVSSCVLHFQSGAQNETQKHALAAGSSAPAPNFSLIVVLHLSLFAWRNAKHNEVQVQTQTPLPIPVYLTR